MNSLSFIALTLLLSLTAEASPCSIHGQFFKIICCCSLLIPLHVLHEYLYCMHISKLWNSEASSWSSNLFLFFGGILILEFIEFFLPNFVKWICKKIINGLSMDFLHHLFSCCCCYQAMEKIVELGLFNMFLKCISRLQVYSAWNFCCWKLGASLFYLLICNFFIALICPNFSAFIGFVFCVIAMPKCLILCE